MNLQRIVRYQRYQTRSPESDRPDYEATQRRCQNADIQKNVEFDAAFDTARGPDVQVVLYQNATVPVNLTEGSYITIAPLRSFSGAQRYLIPAHVNLDEYSSVAIGARNLTSPWGTPLCKPLNPGGLQRELMQIWNSFTRSLQRDP